MTMHYTNTSNPIDFPKQSTIDRLWGKALDKAVPDTYSSLTWTQVEKIKQVFAELIVRECLLELADARLEFVWDKETDEVFKQTVSKIKEHFGVEE